MDNPVRFRVQTRDPFARFGAIGSPHLLMLSGIGPADDLKKVGVKPIHDLPGVGKNLQDHLELDLQWETCQGVSLNEVLKTRHIMKASLQWLLFRRGPAAFGQGKVGAFLRSAPSVSHANIQLMLFPVCFDGWKPMRGVNGFRVSAYPTRPTSRGDLRLHSSSPFDDPLLDPNYLSTALDLALLRRCYEIIIDTVSQKAFDPYRGRRLPPLPEGGDFDAFISRYSSAGFHLCGTCKMGSDDDELAVVDPTARVRGITGLRVADGSIMPSIVSGNTAAAIIMIGDRVSDLVRGRSLPSIELPKANFGHWP